ncbi:MAG: hypothetical protein IJD60_09085 [Clostridia bacterium]|nr:hypothetical protein [Clostridia bacterium]
MIRTCLVCTLVLVLSAAPALADKAPACEKLGSAQAAAHLATHIYAYTDGWNGFGPSDCPDEGCLAYGHVHCYGRRVTLWDTPAGGSSRVSYYPFGSDGKVGPDTEFQLVDVVTYRNKYYANIRIYENDRVVNSGFINADYVGCDCESFRGFDEVPQYEHNHGPFSLK